MKITITVPELKCAKCDVTAPVQPVFLYVKGIVPSQFRETLTPVVKERASVHAADDSGRAWDVFVDDKPADWTKGPGEVDLCTSCTALWAEAGKAFLAPPAPVELPEEPEMKVAPPLPPPPSLPPHAKNQLKREPTVSEIVAARNYENNTPTNNSMMPMVPPTLPRR